MAEWFVWYDADSSGAVDLQEFCSGHDLGCDVELGLTDGGDDYFVGADEDAGGTGDVSLWEIAEEVEWQRLGDSLWLCCNGAGAAAHCCSGGEHLCG